MILLTLETEHFRFEAAGETENEARETLAKATTYHAEQYALDPMWSQGYDVSALVIQPGECFRDGQLLYRK